MKTTIQVSDSTKRVLDTPEVKHRKSYDKMLQEILPGHFDTPRSLAGAFPDLTYLRTTG